MVSINFLSRVFLPDIIKYLLHAGLTKEEVVGNAMLFIFAGFQTTADTMLFIFYELAQHPEIQERVRSYYMLFSCVQLIILLY